MDAFIFLRGDEEEDAVLAEEAAYLAHPQPLQQALVHHCKHCEMQENSFRRTEGNCTADTKKIPWSGSQA